MHSAVWICAQAAIALLQRFETPLRFKQMNFRRFSVFVQTFHAWYRMDADVANPIP